MLHQFIRHRPIKGILFALVAISGIGAITMLLWNALLTELFGLPVISFLQALGLLILSRIIFGHGPGRSHRSWDGSHWSADWHHRHSHQTDSVEDEDTGVQPAD